jgi:hypothetical protein
MTFLYVNTVTRRAECRAGPTLLPIRDLSGTLFVIEIATLKYLDIDQNVYFVKHPSLITKLTRLLMFEHTKLA